MRLVFQLGNLGLLPLAYLLSYFSCVLESSCSLQKTCVLPLRRWWIQLESEGDPWWRLAADVSAGGPVIGLADARVLFVSMMA